MSSHARSVRMVRGTLARGRPLGAWVADRIGHRVECHDQPLPPARARCCRTGPWWT